MQQTKRRSRKGVILLALAIALLVVAIVPAAAMAATQSVKVNGSALPIVIGSTSVDLTLNAGDLVGATQVKIQDQYNGGSFVPSSPAFVGVPPTTINGYVLSGNLPAPPVVGSIYVVKVSWYNASSVLLGTAVSAALTFNNTVPVAVLGWDGLGVPGDYATLWYGGPLPNRAIGTFFDGGGAPFDQVVYRVDTGGFKHVFSALPWLGAPIEFYPDAITPVLNGLHQVEFFAVTPASASQTSGPTTIAKFGWDTIVPRWTFNAAGLSLDPTLADPLKAVWLGNASVKWDAAVTDEPGSGVATSSVSAWRYPGPAIFSTTGGVKLEWTRFQEFSNGTLTPDPTWDAGSPTAFYGVSLDATDMVGNFVRNVVPVKFDLRNPTTSFSVLPVGTALKAGDPLAPIVWTNKDVTLTFLASDPGAADVPPTGSGVAYTEYFVGDTSMSGPGTPTKGSSVTITTTSPKAGPVVVWFRSVDKATPANVEVWQKLFVYIDKKAPVLENDLPGTWIDGYDFPATLNSFSFWVWMNATDINSGIGPKLIEWWVPNWKSQPTYTIPQQIAPNNPPDYGVEFKVRANAIDDGIYSLNMRVSDRASNEATSSTPMQIDTRPPVTDGASGWINGLKPYVLTATDQAIGAGSAATVYRVNQSTPWLANVATPTVDTELMTDVVLVPAGSTGVQGAVYTIDFASYDGALPYNYSATKLLSNGKLKYPGPSYTYGNFEGTAWVWTTAPIDGQLPGGFTVFTGYKTRSVKLDVTAPVVTAMDPKNGDWQKGPGVVNFSGTDVGAGYAYTEWSTDGGTTWTKGEVAAVGGNGEITVTYHGVDKVGIVSANQTIMVKVASTGPSVKGANASAKKGKKATFKFNVTSVTPQVRVAIQIRTKSGRTVSTHNYANVTANSDQSRSFRVNYPKGKYNIRISAVDQAGNNQTMRGTGTLTVK
jgi:hypothetical protein